MTFKELYDYLQKGTHKESLFYKYNHPWSTLENSYKWIHDSHFNAVNYEHHFLLKFGNLETMYDESNCELYIDNFEDFLKYSEKTMEHYVNLVLTDYAPYDNYNKISEIKNEYGNHNINVTNEHGEVITHEKDTEINLSFDEQTTKIDVDADERESNQLTNDFTNTFDNVETPTDKSTIKQTSNGYNDLTTTTVDAHIDTQTFTGTDTDSHSGTDTTHTLDSSHTDNITEHTHGNIGVTTNQQMGSQELDYASYLSICELFWKEYIKFYGIPYWKEQYLWKY